MALVRLKIYFESESKLRTLVSEVVPRIGETVLVDGHILNVKNVQYVFMAENNLNYLEEVNILV